MPKTYPPRFSKIDNWCDWIEGLSKKSHATLTALNKNDRNGATTQLDGLRAHFYNLHREASLINRSDLVYLLWKSARAKKVPVSTMQQAIAMLDTAPASSSIKAASAQYARDAKAWFAQVSPILEDGKVGADESATLAKATDAFFLRYGRDFE